MAEPTQLPRAPGSYLATIELWRTPSGQVGASLVDMPRHVIESGEDEPVARLRLLAAWLVEAAPGVLAVADALEDHGHG